MLDRFRCSGRAGPALEPPASQAGAVRVANQTRRVNVGDMLASQTLAVAWLTKRMTRPRRHFCAKTCSIATRPPAVLALPRMMCKRPVATAGVRD